MPNKITSKTRRVQAQYFSDTFDQWVKVDVVDGYRTKKEANKAIAEHCKRYHVTLKDRSFRIITTFTTEWIEEVNRLIPLGRPANDLRMKYAKKFGLTTRKQIKRLSDRLIEKLERCKDESARNILVKGVINVKK